MPRIQREKTERPELFTEENTRAEELIAAGDLPEAAKILVEIVELDPNNYRAYNNIGIVAWMRKAWQDAYGMFIKSIALKPAYSDALINLFDAALKLRRIADVEPLFQKALTIDPNNQEIKTIHESMIREADGIYQTERGLTIGDHNPRIDEAQALLDDGKLYAAMEQYIRINDEEGPSARVFSGLGVISYYQERFSDAFTLFVESLKLNPTSRDNFLNLLDAAKACNKVAQAREIFGMYLKVFPSLEEIAGEFEKK